MSSSGPEDRIRDGIREFERSASRYQRLEELGRGGMALVYRARDLELNRIVALKVIREEAVVQATALQRFQREAETAARLVHPNIVAVHDLGEEGGRPFLVMELIEGEPLDRILQAGNRKTEDLVHLLALVARGVAFAHQHGVVHRDLKPANILVAASGEPKVADFGLAHLMDPATLLTQSGTPLGTPRYMAPEQVKGQGDRISARTDVYALGAILYEILTGAPPHPGSTIMEIFGKIVEDEPLSPRRRNPKIPVELEAICLKALEKDPRRRYLSAKEFGEDLERFLDDQTVVARPPGIARKLVRGIQRHKTLSVAVGLLVVFSTGLGTYSTVRSAMRSRERNRLLREADGAIARREWERAADLLGSAQRLSPEDAPIQTKRRAAEEMARAIQALGDRDEAWRRASGIVLPSISSTDPASAKEPRWELEDLLERTSREALARERDAEHAALAALAFVPGLPEARRLLADLYLARHEEAVTKFDRASAEEWERRTWEYGGEEYRERMKALVTLATQPEGARAFLFRYEERKGRLFPLPQDEIAIPSVDAVSRDAPEEERRRVREGSAYPLVARSEVIFPLRLRPGSYLFLLRKEGFADTRIPRAIRSGAEERVEVRLLRPETIPPGFVYVPEGRFLVGGDPVVQENSSRPRGREERSLPGFFLARYSITSGEYLEFVNDGEAQRVPTREKGAALWKTSSGIFELPEGIGRDHPVSYVRRNDAEAYAKWYTKKYGRGRWVFRLPTEDEWEKAARGADGRFFSWGDRFDAAFADTLEANKDWGGKHGPFATAIGLYPADESPYGVRDTAGVIGNWTSTEGPKEESAFVKGGSYTNVSLGCRAALRKTLFASHRESFAGFRLAADLPDP